VSGMRAWISAARFEAFGSAGNADKIKVSSLDTMSQRKSVSILTLRTPCLMPSTISLTGTP
jgi:hypothetical protein